MASLSRPSLPSCLCSFLLLLLLQVSSSYAGQFRVIGPRQPIRALVGDEVELPCRISPGKNATGMEVGWYRPPFSRVVHLYRNGRDQDGEQAPEYRGRTELLKDAIGEGKVTLRIRNVRFSDEGGFTCFFRDHSYQEEAAIELKVEDPFYWVSPAVLVLLAVLPVLLLQITVGLVFLCLQYRLRGKLRAEIENLHRTFDPHFLRVPCWKITLFVIVPVLGPLVALIICYNWLHRRLAGQFLEELSKLSSLSYKQRIKREERETEATRGRGGLLRDHSPRGKEELESLGGGKTPPGRDRGKRPAVRHIYRWQRNWKHSHLLPHPFLLHCP
ncbi:PREDICTED: myelin-oligodendrocyte glycoprotein isoform X1 [Mandrillus leucophaeus]|uniref:Myelin oligodendrocyte glycoprotein n=1 Tax=Mandrillus leucophaeus TaxID=9568 RepID=A0A2K6A5R2_MANLE|nr:PREDICTED: myelin-oligodendrocyte glycoprotein isoform X1 [Mandrillus leucophaeus]